MKISGVINKQTNKHTRNNNKKKPPQKKQAGNFSREGQEKGLKQKKKIEA